MTDIVDAAERVYLRRVKELEDEGYRADAAEKIATREIREAIRSLPPRALLRAKQQEQKS